MKRELTDKLSYQMQASAALMRFQNSIGVNTAGPDLRTSGPIPQEDLDAIAALSGDAMTAAESGDQVYEQRVRQALHYPLKSRQLRRCSVKRNRSHRHCTRAR